MTCNRVMRSGISNFGNTITFIKWIGNYHQLKSNYGGLPEVRLDIKGRVPEKKLLFFWILSKLPPSPPIWATYTIFLNAKNIDVRDIQNDSLFKILLK